VKVGADVPRYTDAIVGDHTENKEGRLVNDPFTFEIIVTEATTVTFEPHWGVVAQPDILSYTQCEEFG